MRKNIIHCVGDVYNQTWIIIYPGMTIILLVWINKTFVFFRAIYKTVTIEPIPPVLYYGRSILPKDWNLASDSSEKPITLVNPEAVPREHIFIIVKLAVVSIRFRCVGRHTKWKKNIGYISWDRMSDREHWRVRKEESRVNQTECKWLAGTTLVVTADVGSRRRRVQGGVAISPSVAPSPLGVW